MWSSLFFFFFQKKEKSQCIKYSPLPFWENKILNQTKRKACVNFQHMAGSYCESHPAEELSRGITKIAQKEHRYYKTS